MKKTALLIVAFSISSSLFACWGGSNSGFWEDAIRSATPIYAKIVTSARKNQLEIPQSVIPILPIPYWSGRLEFSDGLIVLLNKYYQNK